MTFAGNSIQYLSCKIRCQPTRPSFAISVYQDSIMPLGGLPIFSGHGTQRAESRPTSGPRVSLLKAIRSLSLLTILEPQEDFRTVLVLSADLSHFILALRGSNGTRLPEELKCIPCRQVTKLYAKRIIVQATPFENVRQRLSVPLCRLPSNGFCREDSSVSVGKISADILIIDPYSRDMEALQYNWSISCHALQLLPFL